ncbi:MAG: thiol reductant ABC exporter subunit CydC [Eggerthellaceae bacterium]|nr:thiol reductant ABC exporter subunit CydC [Eggerthellaceae bacterium]
MPDLRAAFANDTWVKPFLRRYRKVLAASLALGVATLLFATGLMFTSGYLISAAAAPPESGLFELLVPIGMVQIFGLGKPLLGYLERLRSHDWVMRTTSELRRRLYLSLERDGLMAAATRRMGDALGLLQQDIGHVQNLYLRTVFPLTIAWMLGGLIAVAAFGVSWPLGLMLLVGFVSIGVVLPWAAVTVNGARMEQAKAMRGALYARTYDAVAGVADWNYAGRRDDYVAQVADEAAEIDALEAALARRARRRDFLLHVVFGVLIVCVLVWAALHFGGSATATGVAGAGARATVNWIAAFVLGLFPLLEAFAPLPDAALETVNHADTVARLNTMTDPDAPGEAGMTQADTCVPRGCDPVLSHVSFAYESAGQTVNAPVIDDLSLTFAKGSRTAILGPSGTGKSTLSYLLRGDLQPGAGTVTLGGVPTARLNAVGTIHRHVALMQQSSYLFNQSIRGNLKVGNPHATDEEFLAALDAVGLTSLMARLPKGLDTMVDEAGFGLSGGEARRLALARILLTDAPVVILDEPCVNLDPSTEARLLDTIFAVLAGRTIIMITHHLAGIGRFDRVLFLRDGRVALDGSPEALARESAYYRSLLAFDQPR